MESCTPENTDVLAGSGTPLERSVTGNFFNNQAEKKKNKASLLKKKVTGKENLTKKFSECDSKIHTKDGMGRGHNTKQSMKKMGTSPQQKSTEKKSMNAFKVKKKPSRDMNLEESNLKTEGSSSVSHSMSDKDWDSFFDRVISSSPTEDNEVS